MISSALSRAMAHPDLVGELLQLCFELRSHCCLQYLPDAGYCGCYFFGAGAGLPLSSFGASFAAASFVGNMTDWYRFFPSR